MIQRDFISGPTCTDSESAFIGEDIRSAKVLRHIDLPHVAIVYALQDGRIAKSIARFGGGMTTITIHADRVAFEAAESLNCIHDPETGRMWSR